MSGGNSGSAVPTKDLNQSTHKITSFCYHDVSDRNAEGKFKRIGCLARINTDKNSFWTCGQSIVHEEETGVGGCWRGAD